MADSVQRVGGNAGLYRNSNTWNAPTWNEVTNVRDVTPGGGHDYAETPSRQTPIKLYAKTQLDKPVQVLMRFDLGNAEYAAWVAAAHTQKTLFDLLILNTKNTEVGGRGIRGNFLVSITDEAQPIDGAIYTTFELRPSMDSAGNTLQEAVVAAGPSISLTAFSWAS